LRKDIEKLINNLLGGHRMKWIPVKDQYPPFDEWVAMEIRKDKKDD